MKKLVTFLQIAMENLQSETDNTMDEDRKRHEEEYKWEMEDYEKRMYEEEVRRQVRKGSMTENSKENKQERKSSRMNCVCDLSQLIVQAFPFIDRLESTLSCETRKNGRQSSMKKKDREKRRRSAGRSSYEKCWETLSKRLTSTKLVTVSLLEEVIRES